MENGKRQRNKHTKICPLLDRLGPSWEGERDYEYEGELDVCLHCPEEKCFYDLSRKERERFNKRERNAEVIKLRKEGKKPKEIAKLLGVNRITVYRIIKSCKE